MPIASSHRALPVRHSSTSAASPSVQNTTSGASGVTNTAPAITSGIPIHIRTASAAVSADWKRRQARKATRAGRAATRRSDRARTPSSEPPKSAVDAADEEGDHRRMVEIAEGERARPEGVIGFVEGELEAPGGHSLKAEQRDRPADSDGGQKVATRARVLPSLGDDGNVPHRCLPYLRPPQAPPRTGEAEGQRSPEPSGDSAIHGRCGAVHTLVCP